MKKVKCLLFFVLLSISFIITKAQQSVITGKITDASGAPVTEASITAGTGAGTTSDAKGMFHLSVPKGQATITISNVGYKTVTKNINTENENETVNIVLEEDRVGLNTVVVTATSSPRRTQQVMPLSITTYNETKLETIKKSATSFSLNCFIRYVANSRPSLLTTATLSPYFFFNCCINSIIPGNGCD